MRYDLASCGILAVLVSTLRVSASGQTNLTSEELAASMKPVRPWPSIIEVTNGIGYWSNPLPGGNYTSGDWSNLVQAAKVIQQSNPSSVEKTLKSWRADKIKDLPIDYVTSTKLLLTMRVVFDIPEHAPFSGKMSYATNQDGSLNLAWPIVWNAGKPRLVPGPGFYEGEVYRAEDEFREFREEYRFRDLSEYHPD